MSEDADGIDRKMEPTPMTGPAGASGVADHSLHQWTQGSGEDVSGDPGEGVGEHAGRRGREGVYNDSINRIVTGGPWLSPRCE